MKAKRIIITALIAVIALSAVSATRIGITYNDTEYILNTSRPITNADTAYFNGMYDAFAAVHEGRQLWEMQEIIRQKTFPDAEDQTKARSDYEEAFLDYMENYSYGAEGEFSDIYPIYAALLSQPASYRNAVDIAYHGSARFYPTDF